MPAPSSSLIRLIVNCFFTSLLYPFFVLLVVLSLCGIALATQTTEKVSDSIFSGLYYFGGEHIFATDEHCNITVLDLEGNVVQKVLELK